MKEGYDDSVSGFNEAWEIVSKAFAEALASARAGEGAVGTEPKVHTRKETQAWRDDAIHAAAQVAERYDEPNIAADIRGLADAALSARPALIPSREEIVRILRRMKNSGESHEMAARWIHEAARPAQMPTREEIRRAMNCLTVEQDKHFIERLYIVGKTEAADRIFALISGEREAKP